MEALLTVPASQGSYILLLLSSHPCAVTVGRLGHLTVEPGWYLYVGSALGPGGLRSRLRHHLQPARRLHWHIDYLRRVCDLRAIWYVVDVERWEHRWAQTLIQMGTRILRSGFGASDCRCPSHGFFLAEKPSLSQFQQQLYHFFPGHPSFYELALTFDGCDSN
uniref:GIY-YIG nuclease family protein n=1 Tax=Caldilinea aerophila TaxID=133453 RepID=A0A7C1JG02_9CHLR